MKTNASTSGSQIFFAAALGLAAMFASGYGLFLDRPWGWPIGLVGLIAPFGLIMWPQIPSSRCGLAIISGIALFVITLATQNPAIQMVEWIIIAICAGSFVSCLAYQTAPFAKNAMSLIVALFFAIILGGILSLSPFHWVAFGLPGPVFIFTYGFLTRR